MKIVNKKVSEIKEYFRNPRINTKTVEALKISIGKYGFNSPIVIDTQNVIVTGHARYRALVALSKQTAPCYVLHAPNSVIQEYRIRDNQVHDLTTWDEEALIKEIGLIPSFNDTLDDFKGSLNDVLGEQMSDVVFASDMGEKDDTNVQKILPDSPDSKHGEPVHFVTCPHCFELTKV